MKQAELHLDKWPKHGAKNETYVQVTEARTLKWTNTLCQKRKQYQVAEARILQNVPKYLVKSEEQCQIEGVRILKNDPHIVSS